MTTCAKFAATALLAAAAATAQAQNAGTGSSNHTQAPTDNAASFTIEFPPTQANPSGRATVAVTADGKVTRTTYDGRPETVLSCQEAVENIPSSKPTFDYAVSLVSDGLRALKAEGATPGRITEAFGPLLNIMGRGVDSAQFVLDRCQKSSAPADNTTHTAATESVAYFRSSVSALRRSLEPQ